jgi:hypothetical protein
VFSTVSQKREKKEQKKKRLSTPNERAKIEEDLKMMKLVLAGKAGKAPEGEAKTWSLGPMF